MKFLSYAMRSLLSGIIIALMFGQAVLAAPYSAVVMDARDGRVIYQRNGNQPLHPASLTKMMTLYIAFAELKAGRLSLDQQIPISAKAASEPPSKMGLKAGTTMQLRYLLRATAIKSANDAATAIGEAIGGSEANFGVYMTQTARALGMQNSVFKNANGLTASGHYSSAYDMAVLGRHLIYDFPEYYSIFSREYAETPLGNFRSSNIRFLKDYEGADGIKTGFTSASGYNLVGSAKRGSKRVIVSMFGGQSSYQRTEQIGALLDLGFRQEPDGIGVANLSRPNLPGVRRVVTAPAQPAPAPVPVAEAPQVQQQQVAVAAAAQPLAPRAIERPTSRPVQALVVANIAPTATAEAQPEELAAITQDLKGEGLPAAAGAGIDRPASRPKKLSGSTTKVASVDKAVLEEGSTTETDSAPVPASREGKSSDKAKASEPKEKASETATGDYAIQLGAKPTKGEAESYLVASTLAADQLNDAKSRVISVKLNGTQMYRPRFSGMSKEDAYGACKTIQARNEQCYVIAPDNKS